MRVGYPVLNKRLITTKFIFEYSSDPIGKLCHDFLEFLIFHHEACPLHLILSKFFWKVSHLFLLLEAVNDLKISLLDKLLINLGFIDLFVLIERFFVHILSHIIFTFLKSVGIGAETRHWFLSLCSPTR